MNYLQACSKMSRKICIKCLPSLTTSDLDLKKNKVLFRKIAVHIQLQSYQRRKILIFVGQNAFRDQNERSKFPGEGWKNTLKSLLWSQSQSAKSLCRPNVRGIRLWLWYNLRRYQQHCLKQRHVRTEGSSEINYANRNNLPRL